MVHVLLTAFEPYDQWPGNASWETLVELTRDLPETPRITTRLYPVDFEQVRTRLRQDLESNYDLALHLGQAPGSSRIQLEAIGLNVGGKAAQPAEDFFPLVADGPVAYRSQLPLADWARRLREDGFPASISYHAGTYLCNATLYLSHHFVREMNLATQIGFIHLPLSRVQVVRQNRDLPSLTAVEASHALKTILGCISQWT